MIQSVRQQPTQHLLQQQEQELELWHRKVQGPELTMGRVLVQVRQEPSWTVVEHCEGTDERGPKTAEKTKKKRERHQYRYLRVSRRGGRSSERIIGVLCRWCHGWCWCAVMAKNNKNEGGIKNSVLSPKKRLRTYGNAGAVPPSIKSKRRLSVDGGGAD